MDEQSISDILLDFNVESPSLNFDDFFMSNSDANVATANNTVINCAGNDNINGGLEDLAIPDDFFLDVLNDSGNGEGNTLPENFSGKSEIPPIGDDFANPNDQVPILPFHNPCAGCFVLREIVHTNGLQVTKLEIHGEIGIISHAALDVYDQSVQNHEFHMFDFSTESIFAVKNFLIQYCEVRKIEGYSLIPNEIAHFYDALSVGINYYQENVYIQPMASVKETMPGSEQNSVLINGDAMTDNIPASFDVGENIPASLDVGESSLQGAEKGKGKKKTKFAAQRERTAEMKLKDFSDLFDLPINAAAKAMRVCTTVVKKKCRDGGVERWPYRKIKGMKTKISKKKMALEGARTLDDQRKFSKQLQKLEENLSGLYQELRNRGISDML